MSQIRHDPSPAELVTAIEANFSAWIPEFGKLGQSSVNDPPGVSRSITDIPRSVFNSIMDARLAPGQVDATIQAILSDARSRDVPVLWWTGPSTRPTDLGAQLQQHGFTLDDEGPGMAVDLRRLNESLVKPIGLTTRLAQDEASLLQWCRVMLVGSGAASPDEIDMDGWYRIVRQAEAGSMWAYTGWLADQPVATSLLFLAAGVAGIYCVATLPEVRRRGIGAWLVQQALIQARSLGYEVGILQSSEMGLGVYRSLGFQEYCRITAYLWRPSPSHAN